MGASATFSRGHVLGRFEIRELIGEGGMGAIYRAVDTKLGRTVALKVVRADRLGAESGEQARQRFLRETLAVSKVDHRNVVRVLDFGFADDTPYLAMEYLRGRDLGKLVKARAGLLPVAEVVDVMLAVCAAIRACHDVGIIHRDLKPSNVFLCDSDSEPVVKILDFGVSKATVAGDLTRDGQIVGTPQYLAPEQVDGKAVPQTDQYAIGVMLYMCLTRALPYQNHGSLGLLRAILLGKFTPPCALRPDLPAKLEAIILRAMRAAPEDRFESVHALGRELLEFASPGAREQWRSYYLDDRLRASPKASTHAMPLIEAMARGMAGAVPAGATPASGAPVTPPLGAPTPAAAPLTPPAAETPASTPVVTPPFVPPVLDSVALASTATAEPRGGGARRRTAPALIAVGALIAAGAGWFALRGNGAETAKEVAPAARPPASAPVPPPAVPRADPPPVPTAAPPPVAKAEAPPAPPPPAHADRTNRRNNHRPASEQKADGAERPADGVPIMP